MPPDKFAITEPGTAVGGHDVAEASNFGAALMEFAPFVAAKPKAPPERAAFDLANAHAKVMGAIAPANSYPRRAASLIRIGGKSIIDYAADAYPGTMAPDTPPVIKKVMAYPDIKEPMYLALSEINDDLLAPNLGLIPPNTVTLMLTNPPFIEAYMAGANHEFARELLWREYPTDCRGSPFRQFWDVLRVPTPGLEGVARARKLKDIEALHLWPATGKLGDNPNPLRGIPPECVVLGDSRRPFKALSQHPRVCAKGALEHRSRLPQRARPSMTRRAQKRSPASTMQISNIRSSPRRSRPTSTSSGSS